MNLPFFIARRYLLSKRKKNFINIISILSVIGVAVSTAALIIVLSIFNGLEDLLKSLNNAFDPEIKIEALKGKKFSVTDSLRISIQNIEGVEVVTEVIEDYAYVEYLNSKQIVTIKGVSNNFIDHHRLDNNITQGELVLTKENIPYALIGEGVKAALSVNLTDQSHALQIFYIKNSSSRSIDPSKLYVKKGIMPIGVFSIVQSFDENYILVPLEFAKSLMDYGDKRTSIEIKIKGGYDIYKIQKLIQKRLGKSYLVRNQEEQHPDLYRLLKMEKFFFSLGFVLLLFLSSIGIFFSLMMLTIDKKKDISILAALGANKQVIKKIFLFEGGLIALIGALAGLALGGIFCWLHIKFGIVSMGMDSSVTESYPMKMAILDFVKILTIVSVFTFALSVRPAVMASRWISVQNL